MKQLGISFSSNFDDNAFGNVGIRILSRVAYPISPLTENKTSGRNASILKRFVVPRVPREREREKEKKKERKTKKKKRKRKGAKRNERRQLRRGKGQEMKFSSHPFCVSGGIPVRQEVPPRGIGVSEKKEKSGGAQTVGWLWRRTENDSATNHTRSCYQRCPESLCRTSASNSYEGGFELLEISLNVLLINLERLKGMKWSKVYGGFGNLKMKFGVVNMFWGMRKV